MEGPIDMAIDKALLDELLAGDVVQAIAEGAITPAHVVADLAELCRGTHPGRQSGNQITAFKSVGWAGEDLAAEVLAYGG